MTQPTSSVDVWTSSVSGDWSTVADWSLGRSPISTDNVDIAPSSPLVVTFDVGNSVIDALTLDDSTLDLTGGALRASGGATLTNATVDGTKTLTLDGASSVSGLTVGGSLGLANDGVVTQSGGTVAIGDSSSSTAIIWNIAGATWVITDDSGMTQGSAAGWGFINRGTFQKTSGSGIALITANFLSTGTISSAGGGDIEFDGKMTNLSGTYVGSGMIDYGPDGVAIVGPVQVTASCCQTNWGTVDLVGDMTMYDGSTIANDAGAHWNFDGDSSLVLAAGQAAGPDINGAGTIAKTAGTGTSHVGIDVAAEGAVTVATGTLSFEGASSVFSSVINGAGTFQIGAGAATIASGATLSVAHFTLAGGTTTLGENLTYSGIFTGDSGASLDLGGYNLTLAGASTFAGLAVQGAGALRLTSGATVSGLSIGGTATLMDLGTITQSGGDVTLGDSTSTDAAQISIHAGAIWDIADSSSILLGADPASTITINASATTPALLEKTGAGVSTIAPAILNSGTNIVSGGVTAFGGIEAAAGVLDLQGAVRGIGSDNIVGAATLEFDAFVGTSQTVYFSGADGVLSLTDLAGFNAKISGFDTTGSNDALLIGGGWSFAGASESATQTVLSFVDGTAHQTLTLLGDYEGDVFSAQPSGAQLKITA